MMVKKILGLIVFIAMATLFIQDLKAENFIVKDGKPMAEIVTPENPISSVKLAAEELQKYIEKISGAKLPIVNTRTNDKPVHIFVGSSSHTNRMGITDTGLEHGAFLMKTEGVNLVLLGRDIDSIPVEPFPKSRGDIKKTVQPKWEELTGGLWRNPINAIYKSYNRTLDMWSQDTNGSLNAVYQFLRTLGVRWYMPGDLGEIVPEMKNIKLPQLDKIIKPQFKYRFMSFNRFALEKPEHLMWALRMGFNNPYGYNIGHGLREVSGTKEMREAHPEYYAMFQGKRHLKGRHVCYSSKAMLQENVKYVRAVFDIYDFPMVSVMPEDGFSFACECPECMKKATPERTSAGKYSDYIWEYVNNVAKEVYKTHPDKFVNCCAYSTYRLPPLKIKKFNPNVIVGIVGGRGYSITDPKERKAIQEWQQAWAKKVSTKIFIFENYPFTSRKKYIIPHLYPHAISLGMKEVKDISMGESIWMSENRGIHAVELSHINYYTTGRLYWDAELDIDKLLDEYYRLYFGSAADIMKQYYEHVEKNAKYMRVNPHPSMKKEVIAMVDKVFSLLDSAKKKTAEGSVYYQRIDAIAGWLETLKAMRDRLAEGRKNVPELGIKEIKNPKFTLDGKINDAAWKDIPFASYKTLTDGNEPKAKTLFKAFWSDKNLYLAFKCEDPDTSKLNISSEKDDDARAWRGDVIELLIETDQHSFYQLVINPNGNIVDLDRNVTKNDLSWDAMAFAKATIGKDAWYVEVKIPILEESDDPLHNLKGNKPVKENPWHFNFCRQRLRENENEFSAFSPTGTKGFATLMKFAKLYVE